MDKSLSQVPRELAERLVPHPQTCTEQYCTCTGWLIENRFRVEAVIREAMQLAQPQWISVEVRLPEEGKHVLVYNARIQTMHEDYLARTDHEFLQTAPNTNPSRKKVWTVQCERVGVGAGITHWMPLPEPPKALASSLTERETTK
jgi:hypothetical protein